MRPDNCDAAYLWDMLDAARTVRQFTEGLGFDDYMADRKLQLADERALEIMGRPQGTSPDPSRNGIRRSPGGGSSLNAMSLLTSTGR